KRSFVKAHGESLKLSAAKDLRAFVRSGLPPPPRHPFRRGPSASKTRKTLAAGMCKPVGACVKGPATPARADCYSYRRERVLLPLGGCGSLFVHSHPCSPPAAAPTARPSFHTSNPSETRLSPALSATRKSSSNADVIASITLPMPTQSLANSPRVRATTIDGVKWKFI